MKYLSISLRLLTISFLTLSGCAEKNKSKSQGEDSSPRVKLNSNGYTQGNSSGGGGFAYQNSYALFSLVQAEIVEVLKDKDIKVKDEAPSQNEREMLLKLISTVRLKPNENRMRHEKSLMLDYIHNSDGTYSIEALQPFFTTFNNINMEEFKPVNTYFGIRRNYYTQADLGFYCHTVNAFPDYYESDFISETEKYFEVMRALFHESSHIVLNHSELFKRAGENAVPTIEAQALEYSMRLSKWVVGEAFEKQLKINLTRFYPKLFKKELVEKCEGAASGLQGPSIQGGGSSSDGPNSIYGYGGEPIDTYFSDPYGSSYPEYSTDGSENVGVVPPECIQMSPGDLDCRNSQRTKDLYKSFEQLSNGGGPVGTPTQSPQEQVVNAGEIARPL